MRLRGPTEEAIECELAVLRLSVEFPREYPWIISS